MKWEKRALTIEMIGKIATALDTPIDTLLGEHNLIWGKSNKIKALPLETSNFEKIVQGGLEALWRYRNKPDCMVCAFKGCDYYGIPFHVCEYSKIGRLKWLNLPAKPEIDEESMIDGDT